MRDSTKGFSAQLGVYAAICIIFAEKFGNMIKALLFDFDGVVMDTESHYTQFWDKIGEEYLGEKNFCAQIKGTTLVHILSTYYKPENWDEITARLDKFEETMPYDFVAGLEDFIHKAKAQGLKTAIVTSSTLKKMESVYAQRPEIHELFDKVFTSEDFSASKPSPDCYRKAMAYFGIKPSEAVVFEDSINGLISGRDSGAKLVGLATTNPSAVVAQYTNIVIPDFTAPLPFFPSL